MTEYSKEEQSLMLDLAKRSIKFGLTNHHCMDIVLKEYPKHLQEEGACFVTLHINSELRGCIGSLVAHRELAVDIVHNAYAAAFQDPRFLPLNEEEFKNIDLEISILTKPEEIEFSSEEDLLEKIRPNVDGLILTSGMNKGTFLPSVWEQLPTKKVFLQHLKNKAGLSMDYWDPKMKVERYETKIIK